VPLFNSIYSPREYEAGSFAWEPGNVLGRWSLTSILLDAGKWSASNSGHFILGTEPSDVRLSQSPSRRRDVSEYNPLSLSEWSFRKPSGQSRLERRFLVLAMALILTLRFRYFRCFRRLQKLFSCFFESLY
jgi:hypothetical protein